MKILDKNFEEIFVTQIISLIIGLVVGVSLAIYKEKILLIPGMIILLPGFLEMRGNISSTFAARLSSGLFLGVIKTNEIKSSIIRGNIIASFILAFVVSFFLGLLACFFTYAFYKIIYYKIIFLALIAGVLANAIEIILTLFATLYFFKKGHDPNNIMGPFVTSTGDITSVCTLIITMMII